MNRFRKNYSREVEWRQRLLLFVAGFLLFETLSGLAIYFLSFSLGNQIMVIIHTLAGLVMVIPFIWYLFRHWMIYKGQAMNHFMLSGYILMVISLMLCLSGVILTWQAIFSSRISLFWDQIHLITTFAFLGFTGLHVVQILIRDYRIRTLTAIQSVNNSQKKFLKGSSVILASLILTVFFWAMMHQEIEWENEFPSDYSLFLGPERPFAPSLAATSSGGAFDPRSLSGSEGCGTEGCHQEIYDEWQVSAHRYAAMDVGFQKIQETMGKQNGPESTRYCAGCHDPISLFAGTKNIYTAEDDLTNLQGYQEGVSCIACHAITETDIKGNADYVIHQPGRYMYELEDTKTAKFISDFLIRAYPEYHRESLQHKLFKSPEFCAACHKQFIDEEVNNVGWVQLQNQYDKWKNSKWNHPGDPAKTIECRECHMPLVNNSRDPASGDDLDYNRKPDDGKHRSHRFLGANQFMPEILDLDGADEQIELTEKWLRGELDIPEIAEKWVTGPAVPIELVVPEKVSPGEEITIQAVLTNHKPGHDFPTGPIDIIQGWIEIVVSDERGKEIFSSGKVDSLHFIEPGSFIFKVEPVDQYGNLIDKHNLWEMVGVRYNRSMFPGFSDQANYTFSCPGKVNEPEPPQDKKKEVSFRIPEDPSGKLIVRARLNYRKMDQFLVNFLFGPNSNLTTPVTVMSEDVKSIKIIL
jgi:hypothetical protein